MRIISGKSRGTKLYTLDGINTRPTLDRVKEPLFSILYDKVIDATVLDLFAGSGALGLEAISRGAKEAFFCDNSKEAIDIIYKNIDKTKTDKAIVYNEDYMSCLNKLKTRKFDLIFLDPPYREDFLIKSIEKIIEFQMLKDDGIIIAETDDKSIVEKIKGLKINVVDLRKYGRCILLFLNRKE